MRRAAAAAIVRTTREMSKPVQTEVNLTEVKPSEVQTEVQTKDVPSKEPKPLIDATCGHVGGHIVGC